MKSNHKSISEPLHIGKKIKEVWKRSGIKGVEFARLIHRERQAIYTIFKKESIDTFQLRKISVVLNYNFFKDYSETLRADLTEPKPATSLPLQKLSNSIDKLSSELRNLSKKKSAA